MICHTSIIPWKTAYVKYFLWDGTHLGMPDLSAVRKHLKRHGISWEQKMWLLHGLQKGLCALCLSPLSSELAVLDHDHGCSQAGVHKTKAGCPSCIRGCLCSICNSPVLLYLERFPHLQNDFIKAYLARRPFRFGTGTQK